MPLAPAADPTLPLVVRDRAQLDAEAADSEWLLANRLGGFAMGTVLGVPTRRYHGLLVAAMQAPVERVMALNALDEAVVVGAGEPREHVARLTPFHFLHAENRPRQSPYLARFERGFFGCRWRYEIPFEGTAESVVIEKTIHLYENRSAVAVRYAVRGPGVPIRLELRPLVRLADMHHLRRHEGAPHFDVRALPNGCVLTDRKLGVTLLSEEAAFEADEQWWHELTYAWEADRGLDHVEDLASPGVFRWTTVPAGGTGVMSLIASTDGAMPGPIEDDAASRDRRLADVTRRAIVSAGGDGLADGDQRALAALARASDQFIVQRALEDEEHTFSTSVIAGYPWFADWGRDAMIALPGLLLETGRLDEARAVLGTFARRRRHGLIPNRFDEAPGDGTGSVAHYNTIDASLWFIHAACAHARAAGDGNGLDDELDAACREIVGAYRDGTDFSIHMDPADGLIAGGGPDTQITWMDAQRDGKTFTPRFGKPVEVSALWIHALRALAAATEPGDPARARELRDMADRAARSFVERFASERTGGLVDRLEPAGRDWRPVDEIRPNQLLAASLEHGPLDQRGRHGVVSVVREHLLTPRGVRTLAPGEPGYRGRFEGPMVERDAAYHNGTAWPWLLGPYVEAALRAEDFSPAACAHGRQALAPLIEFLDGPLIGQLPEVFDGDDEPNRPQRWRGCIAQAWSVAEVLRTMAMILRAERAASRADDATA